MMRRIFSLLLVTLLTFAVATVTANYTAHPPANMTGGAPTDIGEPLFLKNDGYELSVEETTAANEAAGGDHRRLATYAGILKASASGYKCSDVCGWYGYRTVNGGSASQSVCAALSRYTENGYYKYKYFFGYLSAYGSSRNTCLSPALSTGQITYTNSNYCVCTNCSGTGCEIMWTYPYLNNRPTGSLKFGSTYYSFYSGLCRSYYGYPGYESNEKYCYYSTSTSGYYTSSYKDLNVYWTS